MDDAPIATVDPAFFMDCVAYVQSHHSRKDEDDGLTETIFLMKEFFDTSQMQHDRPWEVMFAIQTRVSALLALVAAGPVAGVSLSEVNSGSMWIREDLSKAAATAPLNRNANGDRFFDWETISQQLDSNTPRSPYDWDSVKAEANFEKHGVIFSDVYQFDWASAIEAEDTRYDYGETRMQALGKIGDRYHVLVYARRGTNIRVISLRKANRREMP